MGDANPEDIVDEKQWDREEDGEGPEENGDEKEKFEEGSKMDGEKLDGETRTREDKEDGEKEKEKKDKDKDNADGDSNEKDEEEDEAEGGGDTENNEAKINEDNEEDTTDKPLGVDVRKEEKPVEENEEGGEMEEQEGEQGEGGEGEEQPPIEPGTEGDDLPDDMNLDGGSDDGRDDGEDAPGDDDVRDGEDDETPMDLDDGDLDPSEKMPEEDADNDDADAMQASGGGNIPEPDEMEEEAPEPPVGEEAQDGAPPDAADDAKKYTAPAFGVKAQGGKDSVLGTEEDEEGQGASDDKDKGQDEDQQKENPSSSQGKSGSQGQEGSSQGKGQEGEVHETDGGRRQEGDPQSKQRERDPPNPFKQRGDVNKAWHRRLNLVTPEEQEDTEEEQGVSRPDDPIDEESGGQGLYEHDRDGGGTEQVLADVAEDEAVQVPQSGEQNNENSGDNEEDTAMDREGEEQQKPRKDERKRDREGKENDKNDQYDSEEAKQLRKKMKQEQDKERKQRNLDEGDMDDEEDVEDMDDSEAPDATSAAGADGEEDASEKKAEGEKEVNDIGGKVYTNVRDKDKDRDGSVGMEEEEDDRVGEVLPEGIGAMTTSSARLKWSQHRASTESHAMRLCEQLRLVLEPTLATRLQGDYRTGKRINMRRVVGYVASGFRKDKIWLRRSKPAKREYQVMMMIDNSSSMGEAGPIALSALATLSTALTRLEVGQLCVAAFASGVQMVHPFGQPFDEEAGARYISRILYFTR